jgi:phosphocarrier protein
METVTVTVINQIGLHARPAGQLTTLVKGFKSDINVYKNGNIDKKHQAKSIISVMALGAAKGDRLTFEVNGEDEKTAVKAIEEFVKNGCGE